MRGGDEKIYRYGLSIFSDGTQIEHPEISVEIRSDWDQESEKISYHFHLTLAVLLPSVNPASRAFPSAAVSL